MHRIFLLLVTLSFVACTTGGPNIAELEPLGQYDSVMIEPVEVAFASDWDPRYGNTRISFSDNDIEKVRDRVASIFDQRFRTSLESNGIEVVNEAGPDVLRISPQLREVYLYAPLPEKVVGSIHVRRVGSMQLRAEFSDASSGESLVILQDDKRGRDAGHFRMASGPQERFQLHQMIDDWALVIAEDMLGPRYASK